MLNSTRRVSKRSLICYSHVVLNTCLACQTIWKRFRADKLATSWNELDVGTRVPFLGRRG